MLSIHNEGKSVFAERFIRTFRNKIYKYITSASKNVYVDRFHNIVKNTTTHIIAQSKKGC